MYKAGKDNIILQLKLAQVKCTYNKNINTESFTKKSVHMKIKIKE